MFLFFSGDNTIKLRGSAVFILILFSCLFYSCSYDEFTPDYNNPNDPLLDIYMPKPPSIIPLNYYANYQSTTYSTLMWTNNSSFESGFIIERSDSVNNKFIEIGRAAAGSTSYKDIYSFRPRVIYYYRIKAYKGNNISAPSNIAIKDYWYL